MADLFYEENGYQCLNGRAYAEGGRYCHTKLCLVATDLAYLVRTLEALAARGDCFWVKHSHEPRDGMYLGRAFFTEARAVGELWAGFKRDPKLFCSMQDDDVALAYRS
jgi:hypothetical protein